ncbi:MAG TPA: glycosyltransferase family 4 protein [Solirubrobacteraceae bacterium]|nr:glycosyltransferase family 4 protein [Solirubrobacteraceae bacterium]
MDRFRRQDNAVRSARPSSAPERELVEPTSERRLHVAVLAPPWIPIPPPGYGGIEFVVALLCDALVELGHDVELFCTPGSQSRATVHPVLDRPHPDSIERALFECDHTARGFRAIDAAATAGHPFDVVHDHSGYAALAFADRLETPLVHTVHGPFDGDTNAYYAVNGHNGAIVCISRAQASMAPDAGIVDGVVHNPIDIDNWPFAETKEDYLLWVGRFVAEKGPQRAIRVAKATGRRLILAGVVQPRQERFFAGEIEPHLDGEQITYVGEVGGARKQQLFADAYAFLMPIRWPEPFGMVMVEAMAAGTPVLAFPEGAAPEVVEDGLSGFLVADEDEMAARVPDAGRLDPLQVRRSAERFAPDRIAEGYERVYRQLARRTAVA